MGFEDGLYSTSVGENELSVPPVVPFSADETSRRLYAGGAGGGSTCAGGMGPFLSGAGATPPCRGDGITNGSTVAPEREDGGLTVCTGSPCPEAEPDTAMFPKYCCCACW